MSTLSIACINANGKLKLETIDSILFYCKNIDLLFITETWLPPPDEKTPLKQLNTHWKQHHIFGEPVKNSPRLQKGISIFINPKLSVNNLFVDTQSSSSLDTSTALQILSSIPLTPSTILCGDFNARIGKVSGDTRWNPRGTKFARYIQQNNLFNWNAIHQYAKPTYINYFPETNTTHKSIIDYFLSPTDLPQSNLKIRSDLAIFGSDHKMLVFSFFHNPNTFANSESSIPSLLRKRWKLKRLLEKPVRTEYVSSMQRQFFSKNLRQKSHDFLDYLIKCHNPNDTSPLSSDIIDTIELLTGDFYESIYHTLHTMLTPSDERPKTWTWFWNKALQTTANKRQACYTRWRKSIGFDKPLWWLKYKEADKQLKKEVRQARARSFLDYCKKVEDNPHDATITRIIRSKTRSKTVFTSIAGPQQAVEDMASYLEGIYDGKYIPQPKNIPFHIQHPPIVHTPDDPLLDYDLDLSPFNLESITAAIKRLPRKKSPGVDHIISEMLQPVYHIITPILLNIFRACWFTGYTPLNWRISQVVSLFKKGDPLDPSCYRPISLTSVFRKMMEYCIQPYLYEQTSFIDIAQGGFKPFLSAMDQAVCLDELMHRYQQKHNHYPTIAFLDIQKAYDTVDRDIIWDRMAKNGCDALLLKILQNLFNQVQVQVIGGNYASKFFSLSTGVLQGSVLSPHLYSIYINSLPELLRQPNTSTTTPLLPDINCLLFADDVALIAAPDKLQHLLDLAEQHSIQLGYRWSPSKCVILSHPSSTALNSNTNTTPLPPSTTYTLYNTTLDTTPSFRYLGMYFNYKGMDAQLFLNNTKKKVTTTMHLIHQIGARTNGFSVPLSIQIYKQYVRPQIEYGMCITNFINGNFPALERIQDDCLRLIVGGFKTSSVKALRVMVNLPSMRDRWYILNSKYNIRLTDLPEDSLIHKLYTTNNRYSKINLISKKNLKDIILIYRIRALADSSETMIKACRKDLTLDPIFIVPMTRKERRRLLRWRLNWLPGMKSSCYCGGEMSRNHVFVCPAIPPSYFVHIQRSTSGQNPIDLIIKNLLDILFMVDQISHKAQATFAEEPDPGQLFYSWLSK